MHILESFIAALSGTFLGIIHFLWLRKRGENITIDNVLKITKIPFFVVFIVIVTYLSRTLLNTLDDLMWHAPAWIAVFSYFFTWNATFLGMSYLMSLGICLVWGNLHPERYKYTLGILILLVAIFILHGRVEPRLNICPEGQVTGKGAILQTTDATCAPAAAANIAQFYELDVSEKELAKHMRTTTLGTNPGQIVWGLNKVGLSGERLLFENAGDIPIPALLIVDHEDLGPESHVIALMDNCDRYADVIDPLTGKFRLLHDHLEEIWHGKTIVVEKR